MNIKDNIRCLIIDDQLFAVKILERYFSHFPELSIAYAGTNAYEALDIIENSKIDLIFLDIQMPDINGLQFLRLCKNKCKFIFTTAYAKYAIDGYEHDVVDFLLKPITFERFKKSVSKFHQFLQIEAKEDDTADEDSILIKGDAKQKYFKIKLKEILFVKGLDNYICIHTTSSSIITYMNLKDLIRLLPSHRFCRIHRSFIVSMDHISYVDKNSIRIKDNTIPIGSSYKEDFFQLWKLKLSY